MQYFFILGKNPQLSQAEIEAVLQLADFKFEIIDSAEKVLLIETEKNLDISWLNNRLGGTVKIGKILGKTNKLEEFIDQFFKFIEYGNGKVYFGFSLYTLGPVHLDKYKKQMTPMAMEIKRILRDDKNINSRYVVSREIELSSVIVAKNKLLFNGAEICFFIKDKEIIFGQTLAVQPFEEFGARDYNRPGRDQVSGMLPPKLARIMINLAQLPAKSVILDPFCGSGTVVQEALLLGFSQVIASDSSNKAITDSEKNLQWLKEQYQIDTKKIQIIKMDVGNLLEKIEAESIDAIITEPFLGPPLKGYENLERINSIIRELQNLYLSAFSQFNQVLTPGGKIVIVSPIFNLHNITYKLGLDKQIEKIGFVKLNSQPLIYFRPLQYVWREIAIWQKI